MARGPQLERFLKAFPKKQAKKSPRPGMCHVLGCRNHRHAGGLICSKHSRRLWRYENPILAFFEQIKDRARRKKIVFTITIKYFRRLIRGTGYRERRGRSAASLHVDRKDSLLGYIPGNLRILNASKNCAKGATEDKARRAAYVAAKIAGYHASHYTGESPYPAHEEAAYWDEQAAFIETQSTHVPNDNQPF